MGHRYYLVVQQPQRQKAAFAVRFAVVLRGKSEPLEDLRRVHEIDAVFAEICPSLGFVPRKHGVFSLQSVATASTRDGSVETIDAAFATDTPPEFLAAD